MTVYRSVSLYHTDTGFVILFYFTSSIYSFSFHTIDRSNINVNHSLFETVYNIWPDDFSGGRELAYQKLFTSALIIWFRMLLFCSLDLCSLCWFLFEFTFPSDKP